MASVHEQLSEQFYQWELRGRGWEVFDRPVSPEPPFRPFIGHYLPGQPPIDDGRRPSFLSSIVRKIAQQLADQPTPVPIAGKPDEEPEPEELIRDPLIELRTS